ncbi:hypothetical protein JOM56_000798 [Amanita muscaria]
MSSSHLFTEIDIDTQSAQQPLLESHIAVGGSDSTVSVMPSLETQAPSAFSVLTIRPSPSPNQIPMATSPPQADSDALSPPQSAILHGESSLVHNRTDILGTSSLMSIASLDLYHTAPQTNSSVISDALATEGGSTVTADGFQVRKLPGQRR